MAPGCLHGTCYRDINMQYNFLFHSLIYSLFIRSSKVEFSIVKKPLLYNINVFHSGIHGKVIASFVLFL
jgi:hypothetical protein